MPHPVVKGAGRDGDLHPVFEQEVTINKLGVRELLFIDQVGISCSTLA